MYAGKIYAEVTQKSEICPNFYFVVVLLLLIFYIIATERDKNSERKRNANSYVPYGAHIYCFL